MIYRERPVGRFQRLIRWCVTENVNWIDWRMVRVVRDEL